MQKLRGHAQVLRTGQTEAELRIWYHLRSRRFMELKFRRQVPLGRYIVDFLCYECRLIIELDGGHHAEQIAADRQREAWLKSQGFRVLRFWNHEVLQELDAVLERVRLVVEEPSP